MILSIDPENVYNHQLTECEVEIKYLDFALKAFRHNMERHCIVRKHNDTGTYAVFTDGKFSKYQTHFDGKNVKEFDEIVMF